MIVAGYACDKNDYFDRTNSHAWSLVKVNNKWLPFDSTWGIFSGKLPVCHIFSSFFPNTKTTSSNDKIKIIESKVKGNYLG